MRRAAVAEVHFFLTASITFTDLHRQGGLTLERCARVCPTSSLLKKNDINPSAARLKVFAFAVIYRVRLPRPLGGANARQRCTVQLRRACRVGGVLTVHTPRGTSMRPRRWEDRGGIDWRKWA